MVSPIDLHGGKAATARRPRVLVSACNRSSGDHPSHSVGRKYVEAVRLAGALPLVVPRAAADELDDWLDLADGVLLTGSPSNVHPTRYGEAVGAASHPLDPERDDWTLPLIPKILARGMPLLAICRGAQETNVALGGTLHQAVHDAGEYADHRAAKDVPADVMYAFGAHDVQVHAGGVLERIVGTRRFAVNSLHGQGVHRLAAALRVEATAPDGLVEAFSVEGAPGFNLCVQWHPEWRAAENEVSMSILRAFGDAVRAYRDRPIK